MFLTKKVRSFLLVLILSVGFSANESRAINAGGGITIAAVSVLGFTILGLTFKSWLNLKRNPFSAVDSKAINAVDAANEDSKARNGSEIGRSEADEIYKKSAMESFADIFKENGIEISEDNLTDFIGSQVDPTDLSSAGLGFDGQVRAAVSEIEFVASGAKVTPKEILIRAGKVDGESLRARLSEAKELSIEAKAKGKTFDEVIAESLDASSEFSTGSGGEGADVGDSVFDAISVSSDVDLKAQIQSEVNGKMTRKQFEDEISQLRAKVNQMESDERAGEAVEADELADSRAKLSAAEEAENDPGTHFVDEA